jgi:hypothetical protein
MQDVRLHIHIENTQPTELIGLTGSLISLSNQFASYLKKYPEQNISSDAKLYIKEIRQGSIIVELIDTLAVAIVPFAENANAIMEFAGYCRDAIGYFLGKTNERPDMSISDCRDFGNMVNPVVADNGGKIDIGIVNNGTLTVYTSADHIDANAIQNAVRRDIERLSITEQTIVHKKVLMTWEQAVSNIRNNTRNRGVIDSVFPNKALKVRFEDEEIKRSMLYSDDNPLTCVYEVDVKIETSQNKPVAYLITQLYETFDAP